MDQGEIFNFAMSATIFFNFIIFFIIIKNAVIDLT